MLVPVCISQFLGISSHFLALVFLHTRGSGNKFYIDGLTQGCGRGYDVVTLALHGFDAYGLEISETAVSEAREFAEKELTSPQACNFGKAWKENLSVFQPGKGKAQFVEGDFFDAAWLEGLDVEQFDVIYDYTVSDFPFST